MRKNLKEHLGKRTRFKGVVEREGKKSNYKGLPLTTILLKDICLATNDKILTDHMWFTKGKRWEAVKVGDQVEFDARVGLYEKGYNGYNENVYSSQQEIDFRLERPSKVVIK